MYDRDISKCELFGRNFVRMTKSADRDMLTPCAGLVAVWTALHTVLLMR